MMHRSVVCCRKSFSLVKEASGPDIGNMA
jgi:hypothetical protein